jgi:hypothetical protein
MHLSQIDTSWKLRHGSNTVALGPTHEQPLLLPYSNVINSTEKNLKDKMKKVLPYQTYKSENSCRRPHFAYDVLLSQGL